MSSEWPLGSVELKVLDLERETAFYEWFGLSRISGDATTAVLGAQGVPLLRLKALPDDESVRVIRPGSFISRSSCPAKKSSAAFSAVRLRRSCP